MEQEHVDDGDVRPAALFRLPRPKAARLAWRPWLRGFVIGALLGAALVFGYFLWRTSSTEMPTYMHDRK